VNFVNKNFFHEAILDIKDKTALPGHSMLVSQQVLLCFDTSDGSFLDVFLSDFTKLAPDITVLMFISTCASKTISRKNVKMTDCQQ